MKNDKLGVLVQSRNGGNIHWAGCGHRSLYIASLDETADMTREDAVAKYGANLCAFCFPEVSELKKNLQSVPAREDGTCSGSGTRDWRNGMLPENWGLHTGNGGTCGHCGEYASSASRHSPYIRKHKVKK